MAKPQITPEQQQWLDQLKTGGDLTPEQIAQMQGNAAFNMPGTGFTKDGFDYAPIIQYGQGMDGAGTSTVQGYMANPTGKPVNGAYEAYGYYDPQGKYQGGRQGANHDMTDFATALAMVAGGYFGGSALANAAGGAGAAGGAAGSAAGGTGGAIGGGAFNAAVDSQLANSALGLSAVGGSSAPAIAYGAAGFPAAMGGAVGTMEALPLMQGAPTGVEGLSTIGTGGGGSMLSGLGGIGGKALGIGASLLGAAAGAQGQKQEQSSTRDIPEWLKPYAQKVLGYGSNLLDQQMTPEAQQGFTDMRNRGQGLLNRPMAGNGYDQRGQMGSNLLGQMYPQFDRQPQGLLGPKAPSMQPQPGGMQEGFYPPAMQQQQPQFGGALRGIFGGGTPTPTVSPYQNPNGSYKPGYEWMVNA